MATAKRGTVSTASEDSNKLLAAWKLSVLLAVIAFIVYANTLSNGFVLDDTVMITNNSFVQKGIAGIPELLATPHQRGHWENPNDEYRPLSLVLFAVEYQLWELNPLPYHLVNILLFAGCVVLLLRFLSRLFDGKKDGVAFLACLLFALHPIHTEVVANIKSGDELLCFLLAFLSLNIFAKYTEQGKVSLLLTGAGCFFLSLLAKETTITFLAVIPIVFFFFINEQKKRSIYICAGVLLAAIAFFAVRMAVLSHYRINSIPEISLIENALASKTLPTESRIATAILIMGYYIKLLLVPYPLVSDYSFNAIPFAHFSDPAVLISLVAYLALAVCCVVRFIKDRRDPYAFSIAFFLVTLSLFSNIFILIKSTMGGRFLFFPSVGFCLIVAVMLERLVGGAKGVVAFLKQPKVLVVIIPVCLIYMLVTINRNSEWLDNRTLYLADVAKSPDNSRLNYFAAGSLMNSSKEETDPAIKRQLLADAIGYYKRAATIYPAYALAVADLGAAYFSAGEFDSAIVYDEQAVRSDPGNVLTRNNLSAAYYRAKEYRENIAHNRISIALFPDDAYAYQLMGGSFLKLGNTDSAIHYLHRGIAAAPAYRDLYDMLSYVYTTMGNKDSAGKYRQIANGMR